MLISADPVVRPVTDVGSRVPSDTDGRYNKVVFNKCNCFWFRVFCCETSNYLFCGYNQDNQECYCKLICSWYVKLL